MSRSVAMIQKYNVIMTTAEQLEEIQLVVFSYPLMMVTKYLKLIFYACWIRPNSM